MHVIHILHSLHFLYVFHILHIVHVDYCMLFAKAPVVFSDTNSLGNIMKTEKNHILKHALNDIVKWLDSINMSCEAPTATKDRAQRLGQEARWKEKSRSSCCSIHGTAYGAKETSESSVLLCEAVQGASWYIMHMLHILKRMHMFYFCI